MSDITVTLPDELSRHGRRHDAGGHCGIDLGRARRAALAAFVDDRMVDLSYPLTADARVRIVTPTSPEALRSTGTAPRICWRPR